MLNALMVAIDGSEPADRALGLAADIAARYGASLQVVHVAQAVPGAMISIAGGTVSLAVSAEESKALGELVVKAAADFVRELGVGRVETTVLEGDPAEALIDHAREMGCDLIVMGNRGVGTLEGLLLGSVSHKVNQHAPCAVLTVR